MGHNWLTKEQVDAIVESYRQTNSIIKTMEELHLSEVKVRRVLITEGMWSSETSKKIGSLKETGMSTAEIAEKLCMSVKNVQAYMPYENGAYGEETKNAYDSRRSRDKARWKIADEAMIWSAQSTQAAKSVQSAPDDNETSVSMEVRMEVSAEKRVAVHEDTVRKMMQHVVEHGKLILLVDGLCSVENGLPVVSTEVIDSVRGFERSFLPVSHHNFVYIDGAPEIMDYVSPGMPNGDAWICPEVNHSEVIHWELNHPEAIRPEVIHREPISRELNGNEKATKIKAAKMKKLSFSQFIDRLSACVTGSRLSGSAYEKILQTLLELMRNQKSTVLVFVNFHLLCDRSGGKNSRYTSVGVMIGAVRQIWDSTHIPMLFLTSEEILKVLDKDDDGRKLRWMADIAMVE